MIGEMDFADIFLALGDYPDTSVMESYGDHVFYTFITYVLFVIFLVIMTIILMNLLVSICRGLPLHSPHTESRFGLFINDILTWPLHTLRDHSICNLWPTEAYINHQNV